MNSLSCVECGVENPISARNCQGCGQPIRFGGRRRSTKPKEAPKQEPSQPRPKSRPGRKIAPRTEPMPRSPLSAEAKRTPGPLSPRRQRSSKPMNERHGRADLDGDTCSLVIPPPLDHEEPAPTRVQSPTGTIRVRRGTTAFIVSPILGEPIAIARGQSLSIGRSPSSSVFFPVQAVSRRHAEMSWTGQELVLRDLDSTNGTFVNGQPVTRALVQDGDRVLIGPFELRIQFNEASFKNPLRDKNVVEAETKVIRAEPCSFSADLAQVSVAEIVQIFEFNDRNGVLQFELADNEIGVLYFASGRIVHGDFRGMIPHDAVIALLRVFKGRVRFSAGDTSQSEMTLNLPTTSLLLEAARLEDEGA